MARPLRIEYPGAVYHVTSRGDRKEAIFDDDQDRTALLNVLGEVVSRYRWRCHAYCLMGNHYHLMIETPEANLAKGMRQLNGVFTQWSNRRHQRSGHLFQGRYKAIVVDRDSYFLELARSIVLNPVRAGMVKQPRQWAWSSYGATLGRSAAPVWLTIDELLSQFAKRRAIARRKYQEYIAESMSAESIWKDLQGQIYLGDDGFVEKIRRKLSERGADVNIPQAQQRGAAPKLSVIRKRYKQRAQGDTGGLLDRGL
ncbi:MAG: Transposase [Deltaproteobacteria bacterium]|nr:Transposase [Deltaproteobacteria bacterium]